MHSAMHTLTNVVPRSVTLGIPHSVFVGTYTAIFAVMSGFTTLVTGLIAVRILQVRQRQKKIMSGTYLVSIKCKVSDSSRQFRVAGGH